MTQPTRGLGLGAAPGFFRQVQGHLHIFFVCHCFTRFHDLPNTKPCHPGRIARQIYFSEPVFSHPDCTVGIGISPIRAKLADFTAGRESHPSPKTKLMMLFRKYYIISVWDCKKPDTVRCALKSSYRTAGAAGPAARWMHGQAAVWRAARRAALQDRNGVSDSSRPVLHSALFPFSCNQKEYSAPTMIRRPGMG